LAICSNLPSKGDGLRSPDVCRRGTHSKPERARLGDKAHPRVVERQSRGMDRERNRPCLPWLERDPREAEQPAIWARGRGDLGPPDSYSGPAPARLTAAG